MFGARVVNELITEDIQEFDLIDDLFMIYIFKPKNKKNHKLPLYHTRKGDFQSTFLTLEQCEKAYLKHGIYLLDPSNLISIRNISKVTEGFGKLTAFFPSGETGDISRPHRSLVEHLIIKG